MVIEVKVEVKDLILNNSAVSAWRVFVLGCQLFIHGFGAFWPVLVLSSGLGLAAAWSQMQGPVDQNASLAATLVLSVVSAYFNIIVTLVCFNNLMQKRVSVGAAASTALGKLPLLLVVLVISIAAMVLGILLFVVPGLILMVTLLPAATLFIIRPMGPVEAVQKSHNLVWGCWFRAANIYSLFSVLVIVLLLPLVGLVVLVDLEGLTLLDQMNLMSALVSPWISAGLAALNLVLCHDLLIRKDQQSLSEFAGVN
ncbi:MAG: hypothetical protein ACI82A_003811 [Candidatus Azotimanducaceae bacterium]|jgi:hypothetical protein